MPTIPQSPVSVNGIIASDGNLSVTDVTTNNVTSTAHGFTPKSPANSAQFLNGAATPAFAAVTDANLSVSDITTNDASTSAHGFAPKLWASAWTSYTPTWANASVGNGTNTGAYIQIGKTVIFRARLIWGSTTSFSGVVTVTLPVTSSSNYTAFDDAIGGAMFKHVSQLYPGQLFWASTTTAEPDNYGTGTFILTKGTNATQPFTWASADVISVNGCYEAA